MEKAPSKNYRPDIDGLRALAVLLVIAFHLGSGHFRGGFVGVDLFFVISGFLVTGIIDNDIHNGKFSLGRFYERRIRRIAPALAGLLIVITAIATYVLLPVELLRYAFSLLAATLSYSNIYFWTQADYFKPDHSKLLLHTWSLSVEEMFYLLLPITLWLCKKMRWPSLKILGALALLSFAVSEWLILKHDYSQAFFMPYSRAWELLTGSILALMPPSKHIPRPLREAAAFLALAMLAVATLRLNSQSPFPGAAALLPCLAAFLFILMGKEGNLIATLLSTRPARAIGLISYSVYLWHWPIILFAERGLIPGFPSKGTKEKIFVLLLSLLVGWLSWAFVEQPFRTGPLVRIPRGKLFVLAGSLACCLILVAVSILNSNGFPSRFPSRAVQVASYFDKSEASQAGTCFVTSQMDFSKYDSADCLKPEPTKENYLLIGDSHASALWFGLSHSLLHAKILQSTSANRCFFDVKDAAEKTPCDLLRNYTFNTALPAMHINGVILTQRWESIHDLNEFKETFQWFQDHKIPLIVVGPVPEYDVPLPLLLGTSIRENDHALMERHRTKITKALDKWLDENASVYHYTYLSPYTVICPNDICTPYADEQKTIPLLGDTDHLTNAGASLLVGTWLKQGMLH